MNKLPYKALFLLTTLIIPSSFGGVCSENLKKIALFDSPEQTMSENLVFSVFGSHPEHFAIERSNLANAARRIYNLYQNVIHISTPLDPRPQKRLTKRPLLQKFANSGLTPFGETLRKEMHGSTVIDLGCGNPDFSFVPRIISQVFGAQEYIGIDRNLKKSRFLRVNEFSKELKSPFKSTFVRSDLLAYLKNLGAEGAKRGREKRIFILEGIEHRHDDRESIGDTRDYLRDVMKALQSATRPGDVVFIGGTVSFLYPASDLKDLQKVGNDMWGTEDKWSQIPQSQYDLVIDPNDFGFSRIESVALPIEPTSYKDVTISLKHSIWVRNQR